MMIESRDYYFSCARLFYRTRLERGNGVQTRVAGSTRNRYLYTEGRSCIAASYLLLRCGLRRFYRKY